VGDVRLDRRVADDELGRDLRVGQAAGKQQEDVELARGELVRYAWVAAKLALLIGVILVGALVLGPGTDAMRNGEGGAEARLIAGSAYDVVALLAATGLSVFKPRRRRRGSAR
jgi:hypothetical protein